MSYDSGSNYKYPKQKDKQEKALPNLVSLEALSVGSLFKHKNTIALKSEYFTDKGAIEAFIVGSGEMFWGGTSTPEDQRKLMVTPISL